MIKGNFFRPTFVRKISYGKVNENLKFQNFDFSRKIEILQFQFFIDFSIEQVSKNNFVFFYQKLPSLKINVPPSSEVGFPSNLI